MSSIEIPDPVITWETEQTYDTKNNYTITFTVRALVGDTVIFERRYNDNDDDWYRSAQDMDDAKSKASEALGERLAKLLNGDD
jgi:hypothetical protein